MANGVGPRPFGLGPYGTGAYSDWPDGALYLIGGASSIVFAATAQGIAVEWLPAAVSGLVFTASAELELSWPAWAPCEVGGWSPAGPCETGLWQPSTGCGTGTWNTTRLEELV